MNERTMNKRAGPKPYMNPYLAGTMLGIVLFLAFFVSGTGLGASGGLNRLLVYVQNAVSPEHIDQVPYLLKMAGGSTNPLDSWIVFLTVGTITGGFISGLISRRVKFETNKGPQISNTTRWIRPSSTSSTWVPILGTIFKSMTVIRKQQRWPKLRCSELDASKLSTGSSCRTSSSAGTTPSWCSARTAWWRTH